MFNEIFNELNKQEVRNSERLESSCTICNNLRFCSNGRILWITIYTGRMGSNSATKNSERKPETSQAPWQQEAWKQLQEEFSKSAQEREAVESAENQTENHIKSNVDYASYLVMTASPHIIVDSNGFRYIVGSFKNTSSVEFDSVDVWFALYDKEGNRVGDKVESIYNLLPGKTWKYKTTSLAKETSYFELAEINVYVDEK